MSIAQDIIIAGRAIFEETSKKTLIDLEDGILVYINLDSGIEYSNIATDSGLSIRLNITYDSFTRFLSSITL
ncbi:hypothetical protein [Macrococcoides caseolyticum]|uniref:hypothetical protein n=1 Tax=Macrococcoides caseolyticum TaxID=69966 RepID=UPI0011D06063|nr:hypothetical protein [Macrococcus caseolyticus]